jgi:ligand-binding sensor domain-containing protein
MRLFYTLILVLLAGIQSSGQNAVSYSLTIRDGLIDNSVYTTVQDKRGFIWFGSWKGLCSYDTREFKNYKNIPSDPRSISSDFIKSSFLDSKGVLWIGTNWGLNRYAPLTDSFDRFYKDEYNNNSLTDNAIMCLTEDNSGNLWIGTSNGISRLSIIDGNVSIKRFLYSKDPLKKKWEVTSICVDPDGTVWAIASNDLISIETNQVNPQYQIIPPGNGSRTDEKQFLVIHKDRKGNIWVGSKARGIAKLDPKTKQFHPFKNLPTINGGKKTFLLVNRIVSSRNGELWLGTDQGLLNFDPSSNKFSSPSRPQNRDNKSSDHGILDLYVDPQDGLWVGTFADGVKYIPSHFNFFVPIPTSTGEYAIQQVLLNHHGELWFQAYGSDPLGNKNSTWFSFDKVNTMLKNSSVTPGECARSYIDSAGNLWVGLFGNILIKYKIVNDGLVQLNRYILPPTNELIRDWITSFAEDSNGLVVGTAYNGLYYLHSKNDRFLPYDISFGNKEWSHVKHISFLMKDSKDNLWIGTKFGVSIVDRSKAKITRLQTANKIQQSASTRTVNSIHEDNMGRVWIILSNDGLYLYDYATNKFIPKNQSKDISGHNILNLQHDNSGNLWLSNELGLVEYNTEKSTTRQYFYNEGIPGSRIMSNSAIKTKDGAIFITTNSGAFFFYPDQIPFNKQPPPVVFTDLKLFNKPVTVGDETGLLKTKLSESTELTFHHDQSIFSVDFAVLNFTNPEKNQYAYKLEGFEKDWNYVKNPTSTYTNLPAGTYTLLIKGTNNDGIWSTDSSKLRITVLPPWWNTWYAWVAYIVSGLGDGGQIEAETFN